VRRVWARKGKLQRPSCPGAAAAYQWLYLYGFVRPSTGATAWFTVPGVSTEAMSAVLAEFAREVGASQKERVLLVLDQAGWHLAKDLKVPAGIHLFPLPAYTPELSPAEHLWPPVREGLANRFFSTLDELEEVLAARCRDLTAKRPFIQGTTRFHWWPKRW
jgi:transposase